MIPACNKAPVEDGRESVAFAISGKLENSTDKEIFLSVLANDEFIVVDSTEIDPDGHFEFNGDTAEPEIYRISIGPGNSLAVVPDAARIEIEADAADLGETYAVRGSEESLLLKALMRIVRQSQKEQSVIEKKFMTVRAEGKMDSVFYYQQKYLELQAEYVRKLKGFIRQNYDSFVATYAVFSLMNGGDEEVFADSMRGVFNNNIPGSKYVQRLNERVEGKTGLTVGSYAPDITLEQPDGKALSLSSLRGKYVLVDFWASWCRPCRAENPVMVALYSRYKTNGFEILGVSLDESRNQWLRAIQVDGLPWRHVSDRQGAAGPAAQAYHVDAIPMTVLLDKSGRIMAWNLRGDALEKKLGELFADEDGHRGKSQ